MHFGCIKLFIFVLDWVMKFMANDSLSGVLPQWFSLFVNKSPMSNLFSAAFNLVSDLFVLPRYCLLN